MCIGMGLYSSERIEAEIAFLSSEEFYSEDSDDYFDENPFTEDDDCNYYNTEDECDVF